jgi:hypothetical protein
MMENYEKKTVNLHQGAEEFQGVGGYYKAIWTFCTYLRNSEPGATSTNIINKIRSFTGSVRGPSSS